MSVEVYQLLSPLCYAPTVCTYLEGIIKRFSRDTLSSGGTGPWFPKVRATLAHSDNFLSLCEAFY